jgi:uncharacterized membrane protein
MLAKLYQLDYDNRYMFDIYMLVLHMDVRKFSKYCRKIWIIFIYQFQK